MRLKNQPRGIERRPSRGWNGDGDLLARKKRPVILLFAEVDSWRFG